MWKFRNTGARLPPTFLPKNIFARPVCRSPMDQSEEKHLPNKSLIAWPTVGGYGGSDITISLQRKTHKYSMKNWCIVSSIKCVYPIHRNGSTQACTKSMASMA